MTQKTGGSPQNVIAINGSPNRDRGNTAQILNPFLEGTREAGADVNLYYTGDLTLNSRKGDLGWGIGERSRRSLIASQPPRAENLRNPGLRTEMVFRCVIRPALSCCTSQTRRSPGDIP